MPGLDRALVENILQRIGLPATPSVDLTGLGQIYTAWCNHVPFDNCRKLIACRSGAPGPLPGDDPRDFFETWLQHGVGATCWAIHGAWCELLSAVGFRAHRAVGTMMVAPDLPPNHGSVIVEIDGDRYLVDASIMFVEPLPIKPGQDASIDHPAWGVQGHWLGDKYAVRWRGLHAPEPFDCRIDEWPVDVERYAVQHEATRTWSPFNFQLNFNLVRNGGRIGVGMGEGVRIEADGTVTRTPLTDRLAYLIDVLGVSEEFARQIPEDIPTPPPPGSRTAARSPGMH
ncbi:MAG: arylamine N-acetyltransferase [Pseudomonadales bacterium]|nr:arylamine N-acetyltransferase [Pseudomonadales bacterium]